MMFPWDSDDDDGYNVNRWQSEIRVLLQRRVVMVKPSTVLSLLGPSLLEQLKLGPFPTAIL